MSRHWVLHNDMGALLSKICSFLPTVIAVLSKIYCGNSEECCGFNSVQYFRMISVYHRCLLNAATASVSGCVCEVEGKTDRVKMHTGVK